jgi:hypothetical protein
VKIEGKEKKERRLLPLWKKETRIEIETASCIDGMKKKKKKKKKKLEFAKK